MKKILLVLFTLLWLSNSAQDKLKFNNRLEEDFLMVNFSNDIHSQFELEITDSTVVDNDDVYNIVYKFSDFFFITIKGDEVFYIGIVPQKLKIRSESGHQEITYSN